jgi:hypothetical protein
MGRKGNTLNTPRAHLRPALLGIALGLCLVMPGMAGAACRQALAIGLDVSGSVDVHEYRLQLDGLAAALLHPEVQQALLAMPEAPVMLAVYEWSSIEDQAVILPWTQVDSVQTLTEAAAAITGSRRQLAGQATAIGAALLTGGRLLRDQAGCWTRTLDLTGDGESNDGPRPREVRPDALLRGLTINALVIGEETGNAAAELTAYFRAEVIQGPGAFVEPAHGFREFEDAMVRKLLKELMGLSVARLAPDQ